MSNVKKNISILLVEDTELVRMIYTKLITDINEGMIDVVETGEEAVSKATAYIYDLILMDIGLPGINGIEATALIRSLEKKPRKKAMIIGITAYESEEVTEACLKAGMNAVISQPIHHVLMQKLVLECTQEEGAVSAIIYQTDYAYLGKLSVIQGEDPCGLLDMLAETLPEVKTSMASAIASGHMNRLCEVIHKIYGAFCCTPTPQLREIGKMFRIALEGSLYYSDELAHLHEWMLKGIQAFELRYAKVKAQELEVYRDSLLVE